MLIERRTRAALMLRFFPGPMPVAWRSDGSSIRRRPGRFCRGHRKLADVGKAWLAGDQAPVPPDRDRPILDDAQPRHLHVRARSRVGATHAPEPQGVSA